MIAHARMEALRADLTIAYAAELRRWEELFFLLGAASEADERTRVQKLLSRAASLEYDLRGDCDLVGALMDELGLEAGEVRVALGAGDAGLSSWHECEVCGRRAQITRALPEGWAIDREKIILLCRQCRRDGAGEGS